MPRAHEAPREIRRHLFFVAGFDPMPPEAHHALVRRQAARFARTWGVTVDVSPEAADTGVGRAWDIAAAGPDWRTRTRFELLGWDDIVQADMQRSRWSHLRGTARTLVDMIRTGTVARYFRTSHRYGLFFVLTYLLLAALWSVAAVGGIAVDRLLAAEGAGWAALGGLIAALVFGVMLMRWPGRRLRLQQSLDLAEFSVDYVHGRRPALDARVAAFAERVAAVARGPDAPDEIVIAGHSLGAMHVVNLVAHALARHPQFGRTIPVRVLTLGSTTAKFALHPAGERLRQAARAVAAATHVGWLDIQSRDDIVSFYKVDPVTFGRAEIVRHNLKPGDYSHRPLVRHVAIRDMVTPAAYRRFRMNVMRKHCQCFLAGDRRAVHDFYAYVCSPLPFDALAADTGGLLSYVNADGSLKPEPAAPAPELLGVT